MRINLQLWLARVWLRCDCLLGLGSVPGMKSSSYACSHRVIHLLYERNCIEYAQDGSKRAPATQSGSIQEVTWTSGLARLLVDTTFDRGFGLGRFTPLGMLDSSL